MTLPSLMKPGTWNSPPVSTLQGLVTLVAVVAFGAWFGFDYLHFDVRRRAHRDRVAIEENHADRQILLEILPVIIDLVRGQFRIAHTIRYP